MVPTPMLEKIFFPGSARCADSCRSDYRSGDVLFSDIQPVPRPDAVVGDPGNHPLPLASQVQRQAGKQRRAHRDADRIDRHQYSYGACLFVGSLACGFRGEGHDHGQNRQFPYSATVRCGSQLATRGEPLYNLWAQATTDLPDLAQKFMPQIKGVSLSLLSKLAGVSMGLLLFIVALLIAGIF